MIDLNKKVWCINMFNVNVFNEYWRLFSLVFILLIFIASFSSVVKISYSDEASVTKVVKIAV